jgi:hypothetical protein
MWILFCAHLALNPAQAQISDSDNLKKAAPKLYIDCDSCDMEYIRTEITFVNYVRDRKDAQIHLPSTTQGIGSGGTEYTLTFSGQEQFSGSDSVLRSESTRRQLPHRKKPNQRTSLWTLIKD